MATIETERQALVALAKQFQAMAISLSSFDFSATVGVTAGAQVVDGGSSYPPDSIQPVTVNTQGALRVTTRDDAVPLTFVGPWGDGLADRLQRIGSPW